MENEGSWPGFHVVEECKNIFIFKTLILFFHCMENGRYHGLTVCVLPASCVENITRVMVLRHGAFGRCLGHENKDVLGEINISL